MEQKEHFTEIFQHLIDTHVRKNNTAPSSYIQTFIKELAQQQAIEPKTIELWIKGVTTRPHDNNLQKIAEYFSRYIPSITYKWFYDDLETFKTSEREALEKNIADDTMEISGLFMTYRYSLDGSSDLARELLHIYKEPDGEWTAKLFYTPKMAIGHKDPPIYIVEGKVHTIGSEYFIAMYQREEDHHVRPRVKAFLFKKMDTENPLYDDRLGLMMSSGHTSRNPAAVRIVIKKIQSSIQDEELITFAKKKVRFIKPSDLEDYNVPDTIPELISNTDGQHILSVNSDAFYAHIGKDTTSQENN